jgi:pantetheine-phosphate adenylyltransferase
MAVYDTPSKALLFSTKERVALCKAATKGLPKVVVTPYQGLTVDMARQAGAQVIIRGLRAGSDFEAEFEMGLMNKNLAPGIEAVYLMASLEWQFLRSSRVKEVAQLGGDISHLVPPNVKQAVMKRLRTFKPSS